MTDPYLSILVSVTEQKTERLVPPTAQDLTLFVRGVTITGYLIPGWQYLEEAAPAQHNPFARFVEEARQLARQQQSDDDGDALAIFGEAGPSYLHLSNAKWFSSGRLVPDNRGVVMRIALASVDAWLLGTMSS